ncbi:hypothetical protein LGT39_00975 [Demequina sp. TTPB684]|uniref:hypothetical protein n=1 Tax=unclassified Demequina TaxID=2620311 RepID=UPI001CF12827|nr:MULTISPECIES: hypothetical protein [unclassified Demequina]MCB2411418.1 hypothetical protein [Demequina sp. TTPB684]UPU88096.1 hypothetical protein LGT36_012735 [Demequina sp. TMPB413]
MSGFVIEYHRKTRESRVTSYLGEDGFRDAFTERLRLEAENTNPDIEIVSLVSDSLESARATHSRYFEHVVTSV